MAFEDSLSSAGLIQTRGGVEPEFEPAVKSAPAPDVAPTPGTPASTLDPSSDPGSGDGAPVNVGGVGSGKNPPPAPAPDLPPVPQVPPPPVSFQLGGVGGGEGASSFARPGSAAARPFRSSQFLSSRVEGGRPAGFGAGSAIVGGGAPVGPDSAGSPFGEAGGGEVDPTNDDELARILAQVAGRYTGR
jgi:hypothetical protein